MSTPSNSDSGNMRPASITMMSSPQRTAMQFMPNSPRPPRGMRRSFPDGIVANQMLSELEPISVQPQTRGEPPAPAPPQDAPAFDAPALSQCYTEHPGRAGFQKGR